MVVTLRLPGDHGVNEPAIEHCPPPVGDPFETSSTDEDERVAVGELFTAGSAPVLTRDVGEKQAIAGEKRTAAQHHLIFANRTRMFKRGHLHRGTVLRMSTIREEALIDVSSSRAWDALADWGALHERLARGFVSATRVEGRDRIVTFASGLALRERLVTLDPDARRLVWSIVDGPYEHHNGSAQVLDAPDGRTRFVWIADVLPDAVAEPTAASMRRGLEAIKRTLESPANSISEESV